MSYTVHKECDCGRTVHQTVEAGTSVVRCPDCDAALSVTLGAGDGCRPVSDGRGTYGAGEMCGSCAHWNDDSGDAGPTAVGLCMCELSPHFGDEMSGGDWCRQWLGFGEKRRDNQEGDDE